MHEDTGSLIQKGGKIFSRQILTRSDMYILYASKVRKALYRKTTSKKKQKQKQKRRTTRALQFSVPPSEIAKKGPPKCLAFGCAAAAVASAGAG